MNHKVREFLVKFKIIPDVRKLAAAQREQAQIERRLDTLRARLRMNDLEIRNMQKRDGE